MSLHDIAQTLAARGREGDSMLVHMTPGEVNGLQALAMAHGGSLSVNPDTGLPEANFLKSILPMIAGGALAMTGIGAVPAALLVGGGTALASKDLGKGFMAGLSAFGGAGLAGGISALGAKAAGDAAVQGLANSAASTGDVLAAANQAADAATGLGAAGAGAGAAGAAPSAATGMSNFQTGLGAAVRNPSALVSQLGGNKAALQTFGMAGAPAIMEGMTPPPVEQQQQPVTRHPMIAPTRYQYADGGLAGLSNNPYYTMSGESGDMYQYLMGNRPYSVATEAARARPPGPTKVIGAQYEGLPQYSYDTRKGQIDLVTPEKPAATADATGASGPQQDWFRTTSQGGEGGYATGGLMGLAGGGRLLTGPGDGVSDSIPAHIDGKTPARLATGEFVFDARTVSEIGNGDTRAGAKKLYAVMNAIHRERANAKRGEPSGADRQLNKLLG